MKRFFSLIIIGLILGGLVWTGCQKKAEEKVVKIGGLMPLSGDGAKYGQSAKSGIDLAIEGINAKGGVKGHKIEVIYEDSQGLPTAGVSAFQKLITSNEIPTVIGGLFSSVTLAIAPIANREHVVVLSPTSSAPAITEAGDYIFRNCASDIFEGEIMARAAKGTLGLTRIAIIYINNDYGVGIKNVFKKEFTVLGGKLVAEEAFPQEATDFRTQITKIKQANPEAVYIIGYRELGSLLKQAKELGLNVQFLSTVMFEDPEILKIAGNAAEGAIYSARAYDPKSKSPVVEKFVENYKMKYHREPDIFAALSYDAAAILAKAMGLGNFTAEGIKKALYDIKDFSGVAGITSFDKNGDVITPAVLRIVKNGQFVGFHGE